MYLKRVSTLIIKTPKQRKLEKTFEEIILKNKNSFYKLAYVYVKNSTDAMDILQESILKAYKSLYAIKDIELLDRWFKRIIINCAIDHIKRNSKIVFIEELQIIEPAHYDRKYEDLYESVDTLSPELKSIIVLKYFQGYTIDEVSEILEISTSQVKNKLHKALKLLRVELKITS
jgi:RNA polymerase sigma-70 factor (ECF subfamily)